MPALQARTKSMKMPMLIQKAKALCIKPEKNEKVGTYPRKSVGRRVHTVFRKVKWSMSADRLLL